MSQPSASDSNSNQPGRNPQGDEDYQPGKQVPLDDASVQAPGEDGPREGERPQAAALEFKKTSTFHRILQRIFGSETRVGRVVRPLLRALVLIVVVFALGVLAAYWRLVQPLQQQIGPMQQNYQQAQDELEKTRGSMESAWQQAETSDLLAQEAQSRLGVERTHGVLVRAMLAVADARQAALAGDLEAAGVKIGEAEQLASQIEPQMMALDARQVASIEAIVTLAKNDLDRDPALVVQDLDRLRAELAIMEKSLLKGEGAVWQCRCDSFRKPPAP
jgi:hypothetical protein